MSDEGQASNRDGERLAALARLALLAALLAGCAAVLAPFLPALLFSIVIAVSCWPMQLRLQTLLGDRRTLAALIACVLVSLAVVTPLALLLSSLGDGLLWLLGLVDAWRQQAPSTPPDWLQRLPLIGDPLTALWRDSAGSRERLLGMLGSLGDPARRIALASGRAIGNGLAQVLLGLVVLFTLLRDGAQLAASVQRLTARIGGQRGLALLDTARATVVGVMFSVLGTALAQAMVAVVGFSIVGAPQPLLLGAATFMLSMAPVGPPIVWGAVALWLFRDGNTGWALFMLGYGLLGISSVDNVLKPFLISRSSHLPFVLTLIGVIGGVLAFGIAGIFVGPMVLALARQLLRELDAERN